MGPVAQVKLLVSDPWGFDEQNDGNIMIGTIREILGDKQWIVELDQIYAMGERRFNTVSLSARHVGKSLEQIERGELIPVNIGLTMDQADRGPNAFLVGSAQRQT